MVLIFTRMSRSVFLLLSLLIVSPAGLFGQAQMGVKGGLNIADIVMTNYINPDVEADLGLKTGLHAGFFLSGMMNERVGAAAELLYSNKGMKAQARTNLHYITLPLLLRYSLSQKIFAEIGPELGYLFSAKSDYGDVSGTYNNRFDLGLDAGFHFDTQRLIFGVRYCAGFFSVRNVESFNSPSTEKIKYQNRVLQLSLGYKLWELE